MSRLVILISSILILQSSFLIAQPSLDDKVYGLLIGSAIGDAAGGPTEFAPPQRSVWATTDQKITKEGLDELGALFKLRDYPRPIEPFGVWENQPPAGTITDDTRLKMIFFDALEASDGNITKKDMARATLAFGNQLPEKYQVINKEWMTEIGYASRWAVGERENAYPTERIWGGVPTVMGSMSFLPVATLYPGDPTEAYRKTYELGYFDNGIAKDINSAIVAGLANALTEGASWESIIETIKTTDPFNYNGTLYVNRATTQWLDRALSISERADGSIAQLYQLLESELQTTYWWEAWVPLVVVFAVADFTNGHPMASMQIILEFGHDTDSYMQVMGAFLGALHGSGVFPEGMADTVNTQMKAQFGEDISDWMKLVEAYQN